MKVCVNLGRSHIEVNEAEFVSWFNAQLNAEEYTRLTMEKRHAELFTFGNLLTVWVIGLLVGVVCS